MPSDSRTGWDRFAVLQPAVLCLLFILYFVAFDWLFGHTRAKTRKTSAQLLFLSRRSTMADTMAGFDDMSFLPSEAFALGTIAMDGGDEYVRCNKCGFGGCDVRVAPCGCTLHAVRRLCTGIHSLRLDGGR